MPSNKYYSSIQENMIASALGWKVVTGSGSRNLHPGDVISDDWLGECKTHTSPGHRIVFYASVWKKICDESAAKFKFPVLFVDDGSQDKFNTWCMFRVRPSIDHTIKKYSLPIGDNLSFKTEELFEEVKFDKPTLFQVSWRGKVVFLSNFVDFTEMFKLG